MNTIILKKNWKYHNNPPHLCNWHEGIISLKEEKELTHIARYREALVEK